MPAIRLFGRKWAFGSDDLFYPNLGELLLRIIWLLVIVLTGTLPKDNAFDCKSGPIFKIFFIGMIVTLSVLIIMSFALMIASAQGGIMDIEARRFVPSLFYLKLVCYPVELGWLCFGFYWGFFDNTDCPNSVVYGVRTVAVTGVLLLASNIAASFIFFFPQTSKKVPESESSSSSIRIWERRCRLLCCACIGGGSDQEAFLSIANTLTTFFKDVDLVPTDIAAGFVLLRESERRLGATQRGRVSRQVINHETVDLDTDELDGHVTDSLNGDWLKTRRIAHFSKFAMACYGWPLYAFTNFKTCGLCHLCGSCCLFGCCKNTPDNVCESNEDMCNCHMKAVLKITEVPVENFLYATFHNELFVTPFMVVLDDESESVLVAIRGTLSLKDALTDMVVEGETLEEEGMPEFIVHRGMVQAARHIRHELESKHLLERAFTRRPEFTLTICGHSLGAGVATILAVLLKKSYPDLRCYAYAPPQGLVNEPLAEHSEDFVCSIFLGYDLVPRLSLTTLEDLKERLLTALHECQDPKCRILTRCATGVFCPIRLLPASQRRLSEGTRPGQPLIGRAAAPRRSYRSAEETVDLGTSELTLAGRLLHVLKLEESQEGSSEITYDDVIGVWSSRDRFNAILIHQKMMTDHLPDNLHESLMLLNKGDSASNNPIKKLRSIN